MRLADGCQLRFLSFPNTAQQVVLAGPNYGYAFKGFMTLGSEGFIPAFYAAAQQYFQLQPIDIHMIGAGALLFLMFWKLMGNLVIKPHLDLIEAREQAIRQPLEEAKELHRETVASEELVESRLSEARLRALGRRETRLKAANQSAATDVAAAKAGAEQELRALRSDLSKEIEVLRVEGAADVAALVDSVTEKVYRAAQP